MAQKALELTGIRVGFLTVIRRTDNYSHRRPYWECLCDCGNTTFVTSNELNRKPTKFRQRRPTISCGCKLKLQEGESNKRTVTMRYKHGAEIRSLEWTLTENDLTTLFSGHCHYCGLSPSNICNQRGSNGPFIYSGVDRKDNALGYIMSNVVSCCKMCNQSKRDLPFDEFESWIDRLALHRTQTMNQVVA